MSVKIVDTFHHPVMQAVPWVLRGANRAAILAALQEILAGSASNDEVKATRALDASVALAKDEHRSDRGRSIPRSKLMQAKITSFQQGLWLELLVEGASCAERVHTQSVRRRRRQQHAMDLAYMCVKPQMRSYVCQALALPNTKCV